MAKKSIDNKIEKANENHPYTGTYYSKTDDKGRSIDLFRGYSP